MPNNAEKAFSRREVLRLGAIAGGVAAAAAAGVVAYPATHPAAMAPKGIARLNPAFRVREISATEIELYTRLGNGELRIHRFRGFEADLLRELAAEREIPKAIPTLAEKHNLAGDDCEKQADRFLHEASQVGLVYRGDKILVKIQESRNG